MKYTFDLASWLKSRGYTALQLAVAFGTTPQRISRIAKSGQANAEFMYALKGFDVATQPKTGVRAPGGEVV